MKTVELANSVDPDKAAHTDIGVERGGGGGGGGGRGGGGGTGPPQ